MSLFSYPAKFTAGSDGRVLVEFIDLPRVATDGKDEREAMEESMDALGSDLSIRCLAARRFQRLLLPNAAGVKCPCRFGWRPNSRYTWPCASSASATPSWPAAWVSTSGSSAAWSIPSTRPKPTESKPPSPPLTSR